jgi:YidC/Oxa1 family membrane protein insertase
MWEWFINFLTEILRMISGLCGDWGLAIILLTFAIRLVLSPLQIKSTKSSTRMQLLQPQLQELQERYADDPERLGQETRKFYSENSFNPLGGCLPLIIQMPVFFALFTVLKNLPADAHFYGILPSLNQSAAGALGEGGIAVAAIYIALDVLFGVLTLVPMLLNSGTSGNEDARRTSLMTGGAMAIMMVWVGWSLPVGVILYYDTSAAWGAIQQIFVTSRIREQILREQEEATAGQIHVNVVRKEKKARPHKKG